MTGSGGELKSVQLSECPSENITAVVNSRNNGYWIIVLYSENEDGDKKGFSDIRSEIQQNKQNATITLVAESLAQFDGDSYNFVKKDLSDVPSTALDVHKNAVKAGIETRMGLLNLFKDLID